jgi:hypothetical protein
LTRNFEEPTPPGRVTIRRAWNDHLVSEPAEFLSVMEPSILSRVEGVVRWMALVAPLTYSLSWYDMLNIVSGASAANA